jgi:hypothetical protein
MSGNNRHLSILTMNASDLNVPIQRHRIQIELKKKTQPCVAYKRLISLKTINTGLESNGGKKFSKQMDPINRQE